MALFSLSGTSGEPGVTHALRRETLRAYPKSPDFDTLRAQSTDFSDKL